MSAKLIYSLTDNENPDLHKQIGCMNGFFQLFDRHRRIAGHERINNAQTPKRLLPPGQENGNQTAEDSKRFEKAKEKGSKKVTKEKRRSSTESSRHSFSSSSCSSSFSSLDYNKTANPEPSPSSQNSSSETPSRDRPDSAPTKFSRKPLDLRDVVKDSMHRDSRGLTPVKTAAKDAPVVRALRYVDSPRPTEQPKPATKPRISSGSDDSFRVLSKPREGQPGPGEDRDGRALWAARDSRRLSYDGRESRDGLRSTTKIKELPRLSLDSRQFSAAAAGERPCLLRDLRIEKRSSNEAANLLQEPGSSRRASSVVARLMGLVDPIPVGEVPQRPDRASGAEKKNDPVPTRSPRIAKELVNRDSAPKTNVGQKFPVETAPWRQRRAEISAAATPLTVYGEIEKRLANLEFKKSGKDLRALKQILEAMQKTKVISDDRKVTDESNYSSNPEIRRNLQINSSIIPIPNPPAVRLTNATIGYKSPIVIMKPAKLMTRNVGSASAVTPIEKRAAKHLTNSFNGHRFSEEKSTGVRISKSEENRESSGGRISRTMGPRLQQRRLGLDRQSSLVSPPDSNTRRRNSARQPPAESNSPGKKNKLRSSSQGNAGSVQSESNASLASEDVDNEVTSTIRADQNPTSGFGGNGKPSSEQPSPISVLDATFYRDESPSPVKKTSTAFKDDEIPYPDEADWTLTDLDQRSNDRKSSLSTEIDLKIHANNHWTHNPRATNSTNTDLLCDSNNPDHVYISQILSASDLPGEREPRKTNPKLFFALEQHMSRTRLSSDESRGLGAIHRRLVFDVVNEILSRKTAKTTRKEPRASRRILRELCSEVDRLQGKSSGSGEENDEDDLRSIICEDMTRWPMNLAEYGKEIPAVVLDLERLIFKDLITELVTRGDGDARHCRQLFYN